MKSIKAVIVAGDMATPYGWSTEACWQGLFSGRRAIGKVRHFRTSAFQTGEAGVIEGISSDGDGSRVMAMLNPLLEKAAPEVPRDSVCLLATTLGEIEYLQRAVTENDDENESCPSRLLSKIESRLGLASRGMVISAACASSSVAIAEAAGRIAEGEIESAFITACDSVSEFLYAGFSSLLALDAEPSRPFDRDREGLTIGEAAGWILMMSEERARREGRKILAEVTGWGLNNDANHMTGPSRDGSGLARAIMLALQHADLDRRHITSISAHGTGTVYNDAMEMKAFKKIFKSKLPVYSIKGAIGHTMAAAGLIEALISVRSLEDRNVPATIGLENPDDDAKGWVSRKSQTADGDYTLSTNSGFGGVNAALLFKRRAE